MSKPEQNQGYGRRFQEALQHLYTMKFGGTVDTLSVAAVGLGMLGSTPMVAADLAGTPLLGMPAVLTAIGSAWVSWRVTEPWRKEHVLPSALKLRSDPSPYTPQAGQKAEGLLVGYTCDSGEPVYMDYQHAMRHLFILGQSGVGKTVAASTLMFQHIQGGGGLLFIDGKIDRSNIEQIRHFCCFAGREHDLYVINPDSPEDSNTYNPVLYGDADEKADGILQLIPSTENNAGSDYFKQEAKQALTTLIRALQTCKLAYNMIDLTVLLMSANALLELERRVASTAPDSAELKEFSLFLDKFRVPPSQQNPGGGLDMKKLKDVFGGIGGRLYAFGTGKFGDIMNTYDPEVKLYEAIRANKIVYIALPTMGKDITARNFGRLAIADLRTSISWLQKLPVAERPWPPFMVFCDEAGSYVNDSWSRIPEQARSAHVWFVPAAQTCANFQAISDELYEMVIGNSWVKLVFKVGTQATALEAAELIGKKLGVLKSLGVAENASSSSSFLRHAPESSVGSGSAFNVGERQQEMYIVTPDELKALGMGECIMTYGGDKIFNLRIPKLEFDAATLARFGEFKVNRFRPGGLKIGNTQWRPANFFQDVDRFLIKSAKKEQEEAEAVDSRAYAAERRKADEVAKKAYGGYKHKETAEQRKETATSE